MLYRILRPLLFGLDPERAHELGLLAASFIARRPRLASWIRDWLARPNPLPVRAAGLEFPNPVGLAAGMDKNAEAPWAWWAFGFGFVEFGTITPRPQPGHAPPRLHRLRREHALVNRMGFNNIGADEVGRRLAEQKSSGLRPPFPVGISLGKNAATPLESAEADYAAAARALATHADFLTLNVSSPNTPGLRTLQDAVALRRVIAAVIGEAGRTRLFVKLAPELEASLLDEIVEASLEAGARGFIATNTLSTEGRPDLPPGGLSGRPLRQIAVARVEAVRRRSGPDIVVIGCGGIDDAPSASAMFDAGADLVQLYTGLVFKGPFLPAQLSRALAARGLPRRA
jgi:dihydroorotate dehydrogenase